MLFIIGLSIALFLTVILISEKEKTIADKLLVTFLAVSAVHLGFYYHHITPLLNIYPQLIGWQNQ
jgi:hypothetical protein